VFEGPQLAPGPSTAQAFAESRHCSLLSVVERGYFHPTEDETKRLRASLDDLIRAKAVIQQAAASIGWRLEGAG
jgi:hypothetical protein